MALQSTKRRFFHTLVERNRFMGLFLALLTFFFLTPLVYRLQDMGKQTALFWLEGFLFLILLFMAGLSVSRHRLQRRVSILLGLGAMGCWFAGDPLRAMSLGMVPYGVIIGFLLYVIWSILVTLFRSRIVTLDIVAGSLCVYMLLGLVWALGYSLIETYHPGSFHYTPVGLGPPPVMELGQKDAAVLYFSFATMTTLGYGDIIPATAVTRMLATFQAIVGQLYLTVLVAKLVGMHIVHQQAYDRALVQTAEKPPET